MLPFRRAPVRLSIVIPVRNEQQNILRLRAEIHAALERRGRRALRPEASEMRRPGAAA